jgi:hypothetical protein
MRAAIKVMHEYEAWWTESATHRVKQEIVDLDFA